MCSVFTGKVSKLLNSVVDNDVEHCGDRTTKGRIQIYTTGWISHSSQSL